MPPNWRSPASPRPGTMNIRSFSPSSIDGGDQAQRQAGALQPLDAVRRGQHAEHGDVGAAPVGEQPAAVLQRAAGGQHRVEHQHRQAGQVARAATPCRRAARRSPRRGPGRRSPSTTRAAARARRRPCPGRPAAPAPAAAGWPAGCPRCRRPASAPGTARPGRSAPPRTPAWWSVRAARPGTSPESVRASRMAVSRDWASGWSMTSTSTVAQPTGRRARGAAGPATPLTWRDVTDHRPRMRRLRA